MRILTIAILILLSVTALPAAKTLEMYVVDVEGGKALLMVSPTGQSMLVDAGFPGFNGRDTDRIIEAAKAAGIKQFDYVLVSHFDGDHVGNVAATLAKMPAINVVDHGENVQNDERGKKMMAEYQQAIAKAKHIVVKPGDKIPIKGMDVLVLTSAGQHITTPLKGAGAANPFCAETKPMVWKGNNEDVSENAMAIGILVTYGRFRMVDMADVTWNKEMALMCPNNPIGTADLLMMSHHGANMSSSPALVNALHARVAIMNNGSKKFGTTEAMQTVRSAPGMERFWQVHFSVTSTKEANAPDDYIANLENTPDGKYIKVSAQADGTFTVTNQRNGKTETYAPKK